MNPRSPNDSEGPKDVWVTKTRLYREWEKTKQEIDRHKWFESEKAGHDIGLDRATVDWLIRFSPSKRRKIKSP
jgi:hypothetical protein